jgi:GMP synthase-like glutamine amidotransferase
MSLPPNASRPLKVALLVNDTPVQPVVDEFGYYSDIYQRWLENSKPGKDVTFQLTPFDVVNELDNYPNPDEYDAIILTGSGTPRPAHYSFCLTHPSHVAASAYSPLPWIERLKKYIRDISESHPRVKLIGICFGHQIIASAMGGTCVPNNGLWEIGVTEVLLRPTGKDIFGVEDIVRHPRIA